MTPAQREQLRKNRYLANLRVINRARYQALKADLVCVHCGSQPIEFDHRDPATKFDRVANIILRYSWSRTLEEIAKCDPVCKRCHEQRHDNWRRRND